MLLTLQYSKYFTQPQPPPHNSPPPINSTHVNRPISKCSLTNDAQLNFCNVMINSDDAFLNLTKVSECITIFSTKLASFQLTIQMTRKGPMLSNHIAFFTYSCMAE